ncbi:hypothetical protein RRG08_054467 [Elysia crispata]|uniref:Uncharacterized protein n=1 Tax=Elysia crispata TaxID=231223 RepID=A0AAE0Y703_9GAST|nr:hypothetical protein RRG08_054467 [Elysia crispata]
MESLTSIRLGTAVVMMCFANTLWFGKRDSKTRHRESEEGETDFKEPTTWIFEPYFGSEWRMSRFLASVTESFKRRVLMSYDSHAHDIRRVLMSYDSHAHGIRRVLRSKVCYAHGIRRVLRSKVCYAQGIRRAMLMMSGEY